MAGNSQYKAQEFIDAIPGTGGIVTKIAAKVGCSWHTAKKYIDNYATVQQAYAAECERVLDAAESVIIKKITEEDEQTAKWYLTMKGGDRGYAPKSRHELTGKDEGPIETKDVTLPDEQKHRAISSLLRSIDGQLRRQGVRGEGIVDATE